MWEKIKILTSSIWAFILPFVRQLMSAVGPILAQAAIAAVTNAATNAGASNAEKRDAAFNDIVTSLEAQGIKLGVDITTSLINAAIEVALQKLKAGSA